MRGDGRFMQRAALAFITLLLATGLLGCRNTADSRAQIFGGSTDDLLYDQPFQSTVDSADLPPGYVPALPIALGQTTPVAVNPSGVPLPAGTQSATMPAHLGDARLQVNNASLVPPPAMPGAMSPREELPSAYPDPSITGGVDGWWIQPRRRTWGRFYVGGGGSLLPNVGISGHAGYVIHRNSSWLVAAEVDGVFQFFDDEALADDDRPAAGDWLQAQAGLRAILWPDCRFRPTARIGLAYFDAQGEPNIVQEPGEYFGGYIAGGFETSIGENLTMGPELAVMVAQKDGDFDNGIVPQFTWRISWWPGCGHGFCCRRRIGDVYAGLHLAVGPGLGGGVTLGQVATRRKGYEISFEMLATIQNLENDVLFSDGDGDYAQLRGGLKASLNPDGPCHWVGRAGLCWLRNTAEVDFLDDPGDYVGGYVSLGYEWDVGHRLRWGPELLLMAVAEESSSDIELVPQFVLHGQLRF